MVDNTRSNISLVKTEVDEINKELISTGKRVINSLKRFTNELNYRPTVERIKVLITRVPTASIIIARLRPKNAEPDRLAQRI